MPFGLTPRHYLRRPFWLLALLGLEAIKRSSSGAARDAVVQAIVEIKLSLCHEGETRRAPALRSRPACRLNIGSGPRVRAGWINVDLDDHADVRLDIRHTRETTAVPSAGLARTRVSLLVANPISETPRQLGGGAASVRVRRLRRPFTD
jgi:hypothetical protein